MEVNVTIRGEEKFQAFIEETPRWTSKPPRRT